MLASADDRPEVSSRVPLFVGLLIAASFACSDPESSSTTIGDPPTISVSELQFEAYFGGPRAKSTIVRVERPGSRLEIRTPTDVPWLDIAEVSRDGIGLQLRFGTLTTDLPDNQYTTSVQFVAYDMFGPRGATEIPTTYRLLERIHLDPQQWHFDVVQAGHPPESQMLKLYGVRGAWNLEASEKWVELSPAEGRGPAEISISIDPRQLPSEPGEYTATVRATAGGEIGDPATVTVIVHSVQFIVRDSIAMSSWAGGGTRTATFDIRDDGELGIPFVASTAASWLSVRPEKAVTGERVMLTASAAGLPPGLHETTVMISGDREAMSPVELRMDGPSSRSVQVGFEVFATPPESFFVVVPSDVSIAADPVGQLTYMTQGTPENRGSFIEAYDQSDAKRVAHIDVATPALSELSIAADGSYLYALDGSTHAIAVIDLHARQLSNIWNGPYAIDLDCRKCTGTQSLTSMQCGTHRLLFAHGFGARATLDVINGDNGAVLFRQQLNINATEHAPALASNATDHRVYLLERSRPAVSTMGANRIVSVDVECEETAQTPIRLDSQRASDVLEGFVTDLAISPDGKSVCVAGVAAGGFVCFDTATLSKRSVLAATGEVTSALAFGPTGILYGTATSSNTVRGYDMSTGEVREYTQLGLLPNAEQLEVSADGHTLMTVERLRLEFLRVTP